MPTSDLIDRCLTLAWSQWTELGVNGPTRSHRQHVVDPEALLLFTLDLGAHDRRLREEMLDWCVDHGSMLSWVRLRNLATDSGRDLSGPLGEAAATIRRHAPGIRWPAKTGHPDESFQPRGRSRPDLGRSALLILRLRALAGVEARADLLHALLVSTGPVGTAELAWRVAYRKRAVIEALDGLASAGFVTRAARTGRWSIDINRTAWVPLVGAIPADFAWHAWYRLLIGGIEITESAAGPIERRVAWERFLTTQGTQLHGTSLLGRPASAGAADDLSERLVATADALAHGDLARLGG